jgi:hypothetical protein
MMPGLGHRPTDEHYSVPTWRMRQLQDTEHAARVVVELARASLDSFGPEARAIFVEIRDTLAEALGDAPD